MQDEPVVEQRYTREMFENPEERWLKGRVLSLEEVALRRDTVISHTAVFLDGRDEEVMFYSNNHIFAHGVLPEFFVSCTISFPRRIAPRLEFEEGLIETAADQIRFDRHCHPNCIVLQSLDELVDYLNNRVAST